MKKAAAYGRLLLFHFYCRSIHLINNTVNFLLIGVVTDVIHTLNGEIVPRVLSNGRNVAHVADVEFDLFRHVGHFHLKFVAHIVLLFLVAREDSDLSDVGAQEAVQHGVAERSRAARDQEGYIFKERHTDTTTPS